MATADEYAVWIVKNSDKKGTPEFDTVAKAYQLAKGETPQSKPPEVTTREPTISQEILQGGVKGFQMGGGPLTGLLGAGMAAGDYLTKKVGRSAGTGTQEFATSHGASPEVAGALGSAADTTVNAIPMLIGGGTGAAIGKTAAPAVEWAGRRLMQSALKPSAQSMLNGKGQKAITTMLENGADVNQLGIAKLLRKEEDLAGQEKSLVGTHGNTSVNTANVAAPLRDVQRTSANQVLPESDTATVNAARDEFFRNYGGAMDVKKAQELKQGTYKILGDKAYTGELKSTEAEASKALARGLRQEIERAIPEVAPINAQRSDLINAIKIATRRDAVEGNKNPMGLSMLAHSPQVALAMMADRSATIRSMLARLLHSNQNAIPATIGGATGATAEYVKGQQP